MKKCTFTRLVSAVMAAAMVCGLAVAGAGAAEPVEPSTEAVTELAYMDLEGASPELRESILSARAQIVYSKSWTVDGAVSIMRKDGTKEKLPEFSDLFPGWNLAEISKFEPLQPCGGVRSANSSSVNYQNNVWLIPDDGTMADPFYQFNATGNDVYVWAHRFASGMDKMCNIGITNMDTGEDLGWTLGVAKDEQLIFETAANVRYGVRASVAMGAKAGYAFMVVSEDPNVKISFKA